MNKVEMFNQTDREFEEFDVVLKVLDSALKKENLDNVSFNLTEFVEIRFCYLFRQNTSFHFASV